MDKTRKLAEPEESVLRDTREAIALEQYRHLADRSKPRKPPKDYKYLDELAHLQFELIKLQEWVRVQGLRVVVIFEGRDAAGKGGVIKRITREPEPAHLPRRGARDADGARARPMVLSALRRPLAGAWRNRPVRPQLVQPRRRRTCHGLLHAGRVP